MKLRATGTFHCRQSAWSRHYHFLNTVNLHWSFVEFHSRHSSLTIKLEYPLKWHEGGFLKANITGLDLRDAWPKSFPQLSFICCIFRFDDVTLNNKPYSVYINYTTFYPKRASSSTIWWTRNLVGMIKSKSIINQNT